ncbi:Alpha-1,3-glucanase/mutanase [Mycena venus]|uniref:Alpha-1,3-glucanase/mutanase n=1 Tax=Mycena venus TaxID=2733690 RepID=A0A8H6WUQ0_9AGAR|nr:Alpha-1,3-glucanase/mutanase [Mycena venus]
MGLKSIAAALALLLWTRSFAFAQTQKAVYAHFMVCRIDWSSPMLHGCAYASLKVGIVENYTVDDWKADMADAKAIGIDGFALNCAPPRVDSYTPKQLANAYQAAGESDFKVFVSFDFAYWQNGMYSFFVRSLNYSSLPGQAKWNGGAIASTFVGEFFDWAPVKAVLPVTALPMLEDPIQATELHTSFDGALSWYAWPTDGGNSIIPGPMTTIWDDKYFEWLAGKPYIMPVSPWFSTHFNSKNWVFVCEQLITDRWNQVLALKPQLVEILTWNDFGESHYISGPQPHHSDDGSSQWAAGMPHDAPAPPAPTVDADGLVYWYRPTPKNTQCTNDTLPAPNGINLLSDSVFVTTMLTSPATLTVTSGSLAPVSVNVGAGIVTSNFTMGVGIQTFAVTRNDAKILGGDGGLKITSTCTTYNFNAYVGGF